MTKHLGPIILWIIIAGIALYVVRHFSDLSDGVIYVRQSADEKAFFESVNAWFK